MSIHFREFVYVCLCCFALYLALNQVYGVDSVLGLFMTSLLVGNIIPYTMEPYRYWQYNNSDGGDVHNQTV